MDKQPDLAKSDGEHLAPEQMQRARVPVKVYRSDNRLMVALLMPGLRPEDIIVAVDEDGHLMVTGHLRGVARKGTRKVLYSDWGDSAYQREVALGLAVDGERANVTYDNGVVVVALPICTATRPARLTLERVGRGVGQRVGSTGQTFRPTTTAQHQAAMRAHHMSRALVEDDATIGSST